MKPPGQFIRRQSEADPVTLQKGRRPTFWLEGGFSCWGPSGVYYGSTVVLWFVAIFSR